MHALTRILQYHSRRMREHQSTVARLGNIFSPIEEMFEDKDGASSNTISTQLYSAKRKAELSTRILPHVKKYLEETRLGSPRSRREFRQMISRSCAPMVSSARFLNQLRPKVKHVGSALESASELPLALFPEIALVGRSNCGKSTLLNSIVGRGCSPVMDKPGSTDRLHFYNVGDPVALTLVDVPGFGFAYVSAEVRKKWTDFSLEYLKVRKNLKLVLLVVDARHGLSQSDEELVLYLRRNRIDFKIVVNKCDLIETTELGKRLTAIGKDLNVPPSQLLNNLVPVSALRKVGIEHLRTLVEKCRMEQTIVVQGKKMGVTNLLERNRLQKIADMKSMESKAAKENKQQYTNPIESLQNREPSRSKAKIYSRKSSQDLSSLIKLNPASYQPDDNSIVKHPVSIGAAENAPDITLLDPTDFVSKNEVKNLGVRGGAAAMETVSHVSLSESIKTQFELDWKNRLELDGGLAVGEPKTIEKSRTVSKPAATPIGYISTEGQIDHVPKGISKWKVVGMKPAIKTPRNRTQGDDLAKSLKKNAATDNGGSARAVPRKPRWGNSFTRRKHVDEARTT